MRRLKSWAAAAAVMGALASAAPASAVTRVMTFSGQVASLDDETHLFAPTSFNDLTDKSFTATLTFNLPSSGRITTATGDVVIGGSMVGRPQFVSAMFSFAGVDHAFAGDLFNLVGLDAAGAAEGKLRGLVDGQQEDLTLHANITPFPLLDLGVDFVGTQAPADTGSGFRALNTDGNGGVTLGVLFIDRVSLADAHASAAPEPAGWALMIGGFGLAGAALRRRRMAAA